MCRLSNVREQECTLARLLSTIFPSNALSFSWRDFSPELLRETEPNCKSSRFICSLQKVGYVVFITCSFVPGLVDALRVSTVVSLTDLFFLVKATLYLPSILCHSHVKFSVLVVHQHALRIIVHLLQPNSFPIIIPNLKQRVACCGSQNGHHVGHSRLCHGPHLLVLRRVLCSSFDGNVVSTQAATDSRFV